MEDRRERVRWKDSCGEGRRSGKQMERGQQVTYKRKWRVSPGWVKDGWSPALHGEGVILAETVMSAGALMDGPTSALFAVSLGREVCRTCLNAACGATAHSSPHCWSHQEESSIGVCVCVCVCVCIPEIWEARISQSILCSLLQQDLIHFPVAYVHNKRTVLIKGDLLCFFFVFVGFLCACKRSWSSFLPQKTQLLKRLISSPVFMSRVCIIHS